MSLKKKKKQNSGLKFSELKTYPPSLIAKFSEIHNEWSNFSSSKKQKKKKQKLIAWIKILSFFLLFSLPDNKKCETDPDLGKKLTNYLNWANKTKDKMPAKKEK